jgi:hypothetical protein
MSPVKRYLLWTLFWSVFFRFAIWTIDYTNSHLPSKAQIVADFQKNRVEPSLPKDSTDVHWAGGDWYTFQWHNQCFIVGGVNSDEQTLTPIKCEAK